MRDRAATIAAAAKDGMPDIDPIILQNLMSDPELMQAFINPNPTIVAAMQEIMHNPASIPKHQNNPEIMGLVTQLMGGPCPFVVLYVLASRSARVHTM